MAAAKQKDELRAQNALNASGKKMSPLERALKNPNSPKLAIAAHCYHVCHGETAINSHKTKREIKHCKVVECPLYPHRGFRKIGDGAQFSKSSPAVAPRDRN